MAIWRDLVDDHGFPAQYASVRRFAITLRGQRPAEAHPVIVTAPGEEGQVDYGAGPMVRHPETGKYRRTRLFVFTLGYSRKSIRLLTFKSSTRRWAELHEEIRVLCHVAPHPTAPPRPRWRPTPLCVGFYEAAGPVNSSCPSMPCCGRC